MALNYVTVREDNLGSGIDARSSENLVPPGYCEDILNGDTIQRRVRKRRGYQSRSGYLPVRVLGVEYEGNDITFLLDGSIDLGGQRSTPIVVHGRTSIASGRFGSVATTQYYPNFTSDIRRTLTAPSGTLTGSAADHGFDTNLILTGIATSTSSTDLSNEQFIPDSIRVDQVTREVDIDYVIPSDQEVFTYYADKSAVPGTTFPTGNTSVPAGSTTTISVPAATHGLSSFRITAYAYVDTGTENVEFIPDEVVIRTDGEVEVTLTNSSGSAIDVFLILTTTPLSNIATGIASPNSTLSVTIPMGGGGTFPFLTTYLEDGAGDLSRVLPNSVTYDAGTDEVTVEFDNGSPDSLQFIIYWEFGRVSSSRLTVTDTESATFTDEQPALTLWGLCHEEIYSDRTSGRPGWVNHIDSYRRVGETRLVAGLGGNLFADRLRSEVGTEYLLPQYRARMRARADTTQIVSRTFHATGDTPGRTRGYLRADGVTGGILEVESITYDAGTGRVDYLLNTPSRAIVESDDTTPTSLSSIISTTPGLEDYLTVTQAGRGVHNGTFRIVSVAETGATQITISVDNPNLDHSDWDEVEVCGAAGIFTDQIVLDPTSPFLPGDILVTDIFPSSETISVVGTIGTTSVVSGLTSDTTTITDGILLSARRTSRVVPLRNETGSATVANVVAGDNLTYAEIQRELRVRSVNVESDLPIGSITSDGTTATLTLTAGGTTDNFDSGDAVILCGAGGYNGTIVISEITGPTTLTFASNNTETIGAGIADIIGKTVEIDEELSFSDQIDDTLPFTVPSRWIPIEAPGTTTFPRYFDLEDYDQQSTIRSVMVNDSLFLSNGLDEVLKFDGTNLYRAGLPRWQPGLFISTDTTAAGTININNPSLTGSIGTGSQFLATTPGEENQFLPGDRVRDNNGNDYTVATIDSDNNAVITEQLLVAGATTLTRLATFRYYYRLNAIDVNNNIVASAVAGSEDVRVEIAEDAAIYHRLVGFPRWDKYDYDRLEVQIYRTRAGTPAPFYRLATVPIPSDRTYIDYTDTDIDEDITDLDEVNTALLGAELGTGWTEPQRAKYVTSANGALLLGHITDYPQLDIRLERRSDNTPITTADLVTAGNSLWSFRRDDGVTGATGPTNGTDVIRYQFVDAVSSGTVTGITGSAGTSFTVTAANSFSPGDWVYLHYASVSDATPLTYCGWWQIDSATVSGFTILYTGAESGAATTFPDRAASATDTRDIPVVLGTDGNLGTVRGNATTSPRASAFLRLANAINSSMRTYSDPWLIASAGGEFAAGQLVVRQPRADVLRPELVLDSGIGTDFDIFIDGLRYSGGDEISAGERTFPSRMLVSFANFPEIFDSPNVVSATDSLSVVDVNSADGQQITGIINFFGESTAGSGGRKLAIVLIFKENSVYAFNLDAFRRGEPALQKLETQGLGCTAPYSIAPTREGVVFANETGVYLIDRELRFRYAGIRMERRWREDIDRTQLHLAQGHYYAEGLQYKLSLPAGPNSTQNEQVYVMDYTDPTPEGYGSWTRYDNHDVTGWANQLTGSFFGSTRGRVFSVRNLPQSSGEERTNYRDDDGPVRWSVTPRALDYGNPGSRKAVANVVTRYRVLGASIGTQLEFAPDLSREFLPSTDFRIVDTQADSETGQKVVTIRHSLSTRRMQYLQLRISNEAMDEPAELAGITSKVAVLTRKGIPEAAGTGSGSGE